MVEPMKFDRIEAIRIEPALQRAFPIGDVDGHPRVVGPLRDMIALEATTDNGIVAWSSIDALPEPFYNAEWAGGDWALVREIGQRVIGKEFASPEDVVHALGPIVGHNMLKAGFSNLFLDAEAQRQGVPLYTLLGGTDPKVEAGISIPKSASQADIEAFIEKGFRRLKIKIGPTQEDFDKVRAIVERNPDNQVMIDANSSFDHTNDEHMRLLREYGAMNLLMMEQPLAHDDIRHHVALQRSFADAGLPGRVCLDESIESWDQLHQAVEGGIPIINIKIARVGGLHVARQMIEYCAAHRVDTWIGGMLEPTPSKAHSLAMATHPGVTLASDISGSSAYFAEGNDPTVQPMVMDKGFITAPNVPGRGWEVDHHILERITTERIIFS